MIDSGWLGSWLQPQHLGAEAMARHRAAFDAHPARVLVLPNVLLEPVAASLHRFLSEDVEWTLRRQLVRDRGSGREASDEAWQEAPDAERFFRYSVGAVPTGRLDAGIAAAIRFTLALRDVRMLAYFEAITGTSSARGSVTFHAMSRGDFLRPHDDNSLGRRLAFVAYLTPDWRPEYGGTLRIVDREGRTTDVAPTYNSLVVFDVTAHAAHRVDPIEPAAQAARRLTIGGWFGERRAQPD